MALIVTDALKFRESENDQFRRLSLSANFNTPVPVSQGGTGADNAADARTNLAVLPLAGGTVTGQVKSTYANADGFLIEHGDSGEDACFRATRSDTGVSVMMGVGSSGINHGVYSFKLDKWMIYGDGSNVYCNGTATNVTGTVAIDHGGTGATSAAAARTNLGAVSKTGDTISGSYSYTIKMRDTSHYADPICFENETPSSYTYKPHIGFHNTGGNSSHPGVINIIPFGTNANPWDRVDGLSISRDDVKFNGSDVRVGTVAVANGGTGATSAATARANLAVPNMQADAYPTLLPPDGSNNWIKIGKANSSFGLLPSTTGGKGSGHNNIGTSYWYWSDAYVDNYYGSWKGDTIPVDKGGTGASSADAARTNLGAIAMPTVIVKNATTSSIDADATYTVSGDGVVIVFAGMLSDDTSDYGTFQSRIYYDGSTIMGEGTRWGSALNYALGASTAVPIAVSNGKKIRIYLRNTKDGTKYVYRRFLCFGCTVS